MFFVTSDRSFGLDIVHVPGARDNRFFVLKAVFPEGELGGASPEIVYPDVSQFRRLPEARDVELNPANRSAGELLSHIRSVGDDSDCLRVGFGETFDSEVFTGYRYGDVVVFVYQIDGQVYRSVTDGVEYDVVVDAVASYWERLQSPP